MVGFRQGRWRPDQIVPKRRNLELSRPRGFSCSRRLESRSSRTGVLMTPYPGRTRRMAMKRSPQVRVTLSDDLLIHLRKTAQVQHVPLRWLVAGLVCDTLEARAEHHEEDHVQFE